MDENNNQNGGAPNSYYQNPPQQDYGQQQQPAPNQPYGTQAPAPYIPPMQKPFSTKAIIAMVCGGLSVFFWPIAPIAGVAGAIVGWLGMKESKEPGATHRGWGLALAGLIVSIGMFVVSIGIIAVMIWAFTMVEEAQERQQVRWEEQKARKDFGVIRDRLELYYTENQRSLGPGGPVVKDGWEGGLFSEDHPKVTGKLKIADLVTTYDLDRPIGEYKLIISGKSVTVTNESVGQRMRIANMDSISPRFEDIP